MSDHRLLAMFKDFDDAFAVVDKIKGKALSGIEIEDVTMMSPIEHPEVDEKLGQRPSNIGYFTLMGAIFGVSFGFFFLSAAQASFLVQPQGGKPVIPLPTNFVLMYEMLIFFAVWTTVITFLGMSGLLSRRGTLYSEKLTVDEIGLVVEVEDSKLESVKNFFKENQAVEIREEKV